MILTRTHKKKKECLGHTKLIVNIYNLNSLKNCLGCLMYKYMFYYMLFDYLKNTYNYEYLILNLTLNQLLNKFKVHIVAPRILNPRSFPAR